MAALPMEPDSTGYEHPLLSPESIRFYREALAILTNANVPHLVGGAYAYARYTGIERHTKDFDVFICKEDFDRAAQAFEAEGYRSELTFPHWLGKAYGNGEDFVDLIFSAGNGVAKVDMRWFEHAVTDKVFGVETKLIPPEEMIVQRPRPLCDQAIEPPDLGNLVRRHSFDFSQATATCPASLRP